MTEQLPVLTDEQREAHELAITYVVDSQNNYFGTASREHVVGIYNKVFPKFLAGLKPVYSCGGYERPPKVTWVKR